MNKTLLFLLSLVALPVYGQGIWGTLNQHQDALEGQSGANGGTAAVKKPGSEVKTSSVSTSVSGGKCEENDQTSLPLAYVTSLIQSKNARLEVDYDPRKGTVSISAPDMISNCSSMLQWNLKEQVIGGKKAYAVEVKLHTCAEPEEGLCEYKVAKVEGGAFKEWERMKLKPTLAGFEECLKRSGVVDGSKVNSSAIYSTPLMEKFNDVYDSGKLLFVSHGPNSAQVKAKYGSFNTIDKCDHFETIHPDVKFIVSSQDEEKERLDAEATKLKSCGIKEYSKVADFIEKYENYSAELTDVRDKLILEAAKKAAKNFDDGKFSEEDIRIMADFEKYIVQPKVAKARQLYLELTTLQGEEADAKRAELVAVEDELKALNTKPYFLASHTMKLIHDGRFDDADNLNTMKLTLDAYSRLGTKVNNVVQTPDHAASRVASQRQVFLNDLESEKENYALRTGQITGKEDHYRGLARSMRFNIETRTANFNDEIQEEYQRMQPGGYCYAYFRNTQKCIQDSMERVQELTELLKHYNKVDSERAAEYDAQADAYGKLEAEGRRYIAAQNGEEPPPEKPVEQAKTTDTTVPARRTPENAYSFQYNPQSAQQMPPQQSGYNPYQQQNPLMMGYQMGQGMYGGYQQQQQPFMGMQSYNGMGGYNSYGGYPGMGGGYSFNWGGGAGGMQQPMGNYTPYGMQGQPYGMTGPSGYGANGGYGMPGQGGFWAQPYGAYNMYSMYGR